MDFLKIIKDSDNLEDCQDEMISSFQEREMLRKMQIVSNRIVSLKVETNKKVKELTLKAAEVHKK